MDPISIPPRRVRVVGAVIVQGGLVLAARRGPDGRQAGLWEFPGGKIEPGESAAEALRREIAEELGCEVAVGALVTRTEHEYAHGVVLLETYWCTLLSGSPTPTVHDEIRWLLPTELRSLDWAPADLPAVRCVEAGSAPSE